MNRQGLISQQSLKKVSISPPKKKEKSSLYASGLMSGSTWVHTTVFNHSLSLAILFRCFSLPPSVFLFPFSGILLASVSIMHSTKYDLICVSVAQIEISRSLSNPLSDHYRIIASREFQSRISQEIMYIELLRPNHSTTSFQSLLLNYMKLYL